MFHFLLYTGAGSLVMVSVAAAVVAVMIWWAMRLLVSFLAFALWRLRAALDGERHRRPATPTGVRR